MSPMFSASVLAITSSVVYVYNRWVTTLRKLGMFCTSAAHAKNPPKAQSLSSVQPQLAFQWRNVGATVLFLDVCSLCYTPTWATGRGNDEMEIMKFKMLSSSGLGGALPIWLHFACIGHDSDLRYSPSSVRGSQKFLNNTLVVTESLLNEVDLRTHQGASMADWPESDLYSRKRATLQLPGAFLLRSLSLVEQYISTRLTNRLCSYCWRNT